MASQHIYPALLLAYVVHDFRLLSRWVIYSKKWMAGVSPEWGVWDETTT